MYSGYPGSIITNNHLLNKKNLLHSHSGRLPDFRGSTTIYYSLLKNKTIYCSTFIMSKKIDSGKILLVKKYPLPKNILNIDSSYDHLIRAKNMLEVIKNLRNLKIIKKKDKKTRPYYVIQPALRTITLNKKY